MPILYKQISGSSNDSNYHLFVYYKSYYYLLAQSMLLPAAEATS